MGNRCEGCNYSLGSNTNIHYTIKTHIILRDTFYRFVRCIIYCLCGSFQQPCSCSCCRVGAETRDSAKSAVGHGAAERFVLGGTEKTQHLPQSNGGDGKILEVWGRWKFNSKNNSLYFIFLFVE